MTKSQVDLHLCRDST